MTLFSMQNGTSWADTPEGDDFKRTEDVVPAAPSGGEDGKLP